MKPFYPRKRGYVKYNNAQFFNVPVMYQNSVAMGNYVLYKPTLWR